MKKKTAYQTAQEVISHITIEEFIYLSSELNLVCDSLELLDQLPKGEQSNVAIEAASLIVHFASNYSKILTEIAKKYSKTYKTSSNSKDEFDESSVYKLADYDGIEEDINEPIY